MLSIGIHITQDRVCFSELRLEDSEPILQSFHEHFFDKGAIKEEKQALITQWIEQIEQKYKGQTLWFCYGLSQNLVTNFFISFPFKEKFKILKTLPFEIEEKTPFQSDKVFFDARICKIENKTKSSALCFVTPKDSVNELMPIYKSKSPYLMSCEGSALANLLESWNKPLSQVQNPMSPSVFIYLGVDVSQLLFYRKGCLERISVLDWGILPIIKEMQKTYTLSWEQAWQEFFEKSFILTEAKGFTKEQVFFSNLVKKKLDLLLPQLSLLRLSLETEYKTPIKELSLFGPGAGIKNLTAFLTTQSSIPVSRLKQIVSVPSFQLNDQPLALISLGLALEGLKSSPYPGLNFFQSIKKESFSFLSKKGTVMSLTFLILFSVFTSYSIVRKQESLKVLNKMESVFINYGKNISFMKESRINTKSLDSFIEKKEKTIKNKQIIQDKMQLPNPIDKLRVLSQNLGRASKWNLRILYLNIEDSKITIKGLAQSNLLKDFQLELKSLAKGRLKDRSSKERSQFTKEIKKNLKKLKEKVSSPDEQEEVKRTFFSYTFELKEGV